jgi:hypothetical protein
MEDMEVMEDMEEDADMEEAGMEEAGMEEAVEAVGGIGHGMNHLQFLHIL